MKHGLANGAVGIVKRTEWPPLRTDLVEPRKLPQALVVEFHYSGITINLPGIGVSSTNCVVTLSADPVLGGDNAQIASDNVS